MKRIFVMTLVLMMTVVLCACSNDSISRESTDSNLPLLEVCLLYTSDAADEL